MKLPIVTASIFLGCLLSVVPTDVSAPSAQGLHQLLGEPSIEQFQVRSGVTLSVEYGPDRLACQMLIAPRRLLDEVENPGGTMPSESVSAVLQKLLQSATTGKQIDSDTNQVNGITLLTTEYEYVSVRRFCSSPSCASSKENQDVRTVLLFKRDACPRKVQ
jgi:hypothetical protein